MTAYRHGAGSLIPPAVGALAPAPPARADRAAPAGGGATPAALAFRAHCTGPGAPQPPPSPGHDKEPAVACRWPLRDFTELAPLPVAVPCARRHARHVLAKWRLGALAEGAELVVAELVTNAVAASPSAQRVPPVRLWLLAVACRVMIVVWDACPHPPVRIDAGYDDETGRGLVLVEATSSQWGAYPTSQPGGKAVWAVVGET